MYINTLLYFQFKNVGLGLLRKSNYIQGRQPLSFVSCEKFIKSNNFSLGTPGRKPISILFKNKEINLITRLKPGMSTESKPAKLRKMEDNLVWVDLEMTGLDVNNEEIMEAAVIITNSDLEIVKEGPNLVLKVDDKCLDNMGDWCKAHHGDSGLTEACRKSDITLSMAEEQILQFVTQFTEPGKSPLAGNSIHADKRFLDKYMPKLMKHLHYRIVDVSTVKELCRRWYPTEFAAAPTKKLTHRALEDIKESIEELKYYRNSVFK